MLFAAALLFASCDSGGGGEDKNSDPTSITYTSTDDTGNKYELEIKAAGRAAAYAPKAGDSYILTILIGATTSKSTGTVGAVTGLTITLKHTGEVEFTVTVSGSSIASFSAAIPVDSGGTVPKPEISKPVGGGTISGTYIDEDDDNSFTLIFSGGTSGTVTMTASAFGMQIRAGGNYTVTGNTITITITSSNNPFIQAGEKYTYTIIDDNTILDDEDSTILKKR